MARRPSCCRFRNAGSYGRPRDPDQYSRLIPGSAGAEIAMVPGTSAVEFKPDTAQMLPNRRKWTLSRHQRERFSDARS
jgi:hypothetical protein